MNTENIIAKTFLRVMLLGAFAGKAATPEATEYTTYTQTIEIDVPDLDREYDYFLLNDTHLCIANDEIKPEYTEVVLSRINYFSHNGKYACDNFKDWISNLDAIHLSGIILNADIIDQKSATNLSFVSDVMENQPLKYMYLMSDHDTCSDWMNLNENSRDTIDSIMAKNGYGEPFYTFEEDKFIILGMNLSWKSISDSALDALKKIFEKNKPIILVTHVPYDSLVNDDLAGVSREYKNDKVLLWGKRNDNQYYPQGAMDEFISMVSSDDSPVVAIIGAHLHTDFQTNFTDSIPEYLTGTGYSGVRTLLKIK